MNRLKLSRVALCAIDTLNPHLAVSAIQRSLNCCDFDDAVLITNVPTTAPCRVHLIQALAGTDAYSKFVIEKLSNLISSEFVLIVQWDGWVVNASAWRDEFLNYDYIGAKWIWLNDKMTVGNGGFSLRSRKLLEILAYAPIPLANGQPEDFYICRTLRPWLEEHHGVRFAPEPLADAFSYELQKPSRPTFGFHGLCNLWRHIDDAQVHDLALCLSDTILWSQHYTRLVAQYALLRKFGPLKTLYKRLYDQNNQNELLIHFTNNLGNAETARIVIEISMAALETSWPET